MFEQNKTENVEQNQQIDPKMIEKLDNYAIERWEVSKILNFFKYLL